MQQVHYTVPLPSCGAKFWWFSVPAVKWGLQLCMHHAAIRTKDEGMFPACDGSTAALVVPYSCIVSSFVAWNKLVSKL